MVPFSSLDRVNGRRRDLGSFGFLGCPYSSTGGLGSAAPFAHLVAHAEKVIHHRVVGKCKEACVIVKDVSLVDCPGWSCVRGARRVNIEMKENIVAIISGTCIDKVTSTDDNVASRVVQKFLNTFVIYNFNKV